ncbi:hypothetical protein AYI70_g7430 [Smittium culicis]|uniref:Uncharacterized protein n=1 Tax=Smittium culicis TaxID=133412 RepID=A0A1R1XKQ2_9FUNG|nr:hypothetical protein AYI70_g7430 [Smittium culicis]
MIQDQLKILTDMIQQLISERERNSETEDPYVATMIPVTGLKVYPELTETLLSIEEDFFRTPLTEEERKIAIHSCPETSSVNYIPPPLNDSASSAVKKADSVIYGIQLSLAQATRPVDYCVHRRIQQAPRINTALDIEDTFASTMRDLLADIGATVTQDRLDNLHKGLDLPEKHTQLTESDTKPLIDQEALDVLISKKYVVKRQRVQSFCMRRLNTIPRDTNSSNTSTALSTNAPTTAEFNPSSRNAYRQSSLCGRSRGRGRGSQLKDSRWARNILERGFRIPFKNHYSPAPKSRSFDTKIRPRFRSSSHFERCPKRTFRIGKNLAGAFRNEKNLGGAFGLTPSESPSNASSDVLTTSPAFHDPKKRLEASDQSWASASSTNTWRSKTCRKYYLTSLDLQEVFMHILVYKNCMKYLRFHWNGRFFQFRVLPFGLSLSPLVQGQRREIGYLPIPVCHTPGNGHQYKENGPQGSIKQDQRSSTRGKQATERREDDIEMSNELYWESTINVDCSASGSPYALPTSRTKESIAVDSEIMDIDSHTDETCHSEHFFLEGQTDVMERALILARDARIENIHGFQRHSLGNSGGIPNVLRIMESKRGKNAHKRQGITHSTVRPQTQE